MTMIQQENIDILGTFSSHRLDLEASLSDGAAEAIPATIFRDLGEGPQHVCIRLANPIKDRMGSYDDTDPVCLRESISPAASLGGGAGLPLPRHHDSAPVVVRPLGCSSSNTMLVLPSPPAAAAPFGGAGPPRIDFSRYFQTFSSVAIHGSCGGAPPLADDDDCSLSSGASSILSPRARDFDGDRALGGAFSWRSHEE